MKEKMLSGGFSFWQPNSKISVEDCNSIISLAKEMKFFESGIINPDGVMVDKDTRIGKINFDNQQWVYDLIWPYMKEANRKAEWDFEISSAESYQIAKYEVGDHYKTHIDSLGTQSTRWIAEDNSYLHNKVRKMSMSLTLNDDYEGGDLILYSTGTVKQETGSMVFFPSFLPHEVRPVTKGTRYSLVLWFLGNPWR
mgnify:CR=1 FL=1|jgi:PKHD-type hydroxylase